MCCDADEYCDLWEPTVEPHDPDRDGARRCCMCRLDIKTGQWREKLYYELWSDCECGCQDECDCGCEACEDGHHVTDRDTEWRCDVCMQLVRMWQDQDDCGCRMSGHGEWEADMLAEEPDLGININHPEDVGLHCYPVLDPDSLDPQECLMDPERVQWWYPSRYHAAAAALRLIPRTYRLGDDVGLRPKAGA